MRERCAGRQSWPVYSRKYATVFFLGASGVLWAMSFHCFSCVRDCRLLLNTVLTACLMHMVAEWYDVVVFGCCGHIAPRFASVSAISFPFVPQCDGIHCKTIVLCFFM